MIRYMSALLAFLISLSSVALGQFNLNLDRDWLKDPAFLARLLQKDTIDANDITDDTVVNVSLASGKKVVVNLDLSILFDGLSNTNKEMRIHARTLDNVKPTCAELRKALGFDIKTTCYANMNNSAVKIGSDGNPGSECTTTTVKKTETVRECRDVCHVVDISGGGCLEPDQICTNRVITKNVPVTTCEETDYTVYFDTTGNERVNDTVMKSFVKVTRVNFKRDGSSKEKTEFRSKALDVKTEAWLRLQCDDDAFIGKSFTDFKNIKRYSYSSIHRACPEKRVRLVSNRPFYFNVGVIEFNFDGY